MNISYEQIRAFVSVAELGIETDITIYHSDLVPMQLIADVMMGLRAEFKDVMCIGYIEITRK